MRKVGNIAVTAQCLLDGRALGSIALKATVVLGLADNVDADAVAGPKLLSVLSSSSPPSPSPTPPRASPPHTTPSGRPSPRRSSTRGSPTPSAAPPLSSPPGRPSPPSPTPSTPQQVRWARLSSPPGHLSPLSSGTPSSPPGYPLPEYTPVYDALHSQPVNLSPYSSNVSAFKQCFNQADEMADPSQELMYLEEVVDPGGVADQDADGIYNFSDYASFYETGHGRAKCNPRMCVKPGQQEEAIPSNCGFNQDWIKPKNFKQCGSMCRGGLCQCLKKYS